MTTKQEFLDILTNPRQAEVKRRLGELMQAYTELQCHCSFQLELTEETEDSFRICIITEDKRILYRTEHWFRHYFHGHGYPTSIYAPLKQYDPERWTHYYNIIKL